VLLAIAGAAPTLDVAKWLRSEKGAQLPDQYMSRGHPLDMEARPTDMNMPWTLEAVKW
jgi:hypothetical protein